MAREHQSHNFDFLRAYEPQLDRLGALAERYFRDDPNTCLIKLRQLGELLAQEVAARVGLYSAPEEPQSDLLRRLKAERAVPPQAMDLFHQVRIAGNQATHAHADSTREPRRAGALGVLYPVVPGAPTYSGCPVSEA
jgi:type I restriction enzyme, R subunit